MNSYFEKFIMNDVHVVIGGGTASLFLVTELIDHGDSVILLERGSSELSNIISDPNNWGKVTDHELHLQTAPQVSLFGRQITYRQGVGFGGTSNLNAMICTGGYFSLYDSTWPAEWNSKTMNRLVLDRHNRMHGNELIQVDS